MARNVSRWVWLVGSIAGALLLVSAANAPAQSATVTITTSPANPTTSTTASFAFSTSGAPGGSLVQCSLDGTVRASPPCSDGLGGGVTYTGLALGSHTFEVQLRSPTGVLLDSKDRKSVV